MFPMLFKNSQKILLMICPQQASRHDILNIPDISININTVVSTSIEPQSPNIFNIIQKLKMSLPVVPDKVGFQSIEGEEEGSVSAINRSTLKYQQQSQALRDSPSKPWKIIVIAICIFAIAGIIFSSIMDVKMILSKASLKAERKKISELQATIKNQSDALKEEQQRSARLQTMSKQQSQELKTEKSKSAALDANSKVLETKVLKYLEKQMVFQEQQKKLKAEKSKNTELQAKIKRQTQASNAQKQPQAELSATIKSQSEKIAQKQKTIDSLTSQVASLKESLKTSSQNLQKIKSETPIAKADPKNPNVVIDIEYTTDGYAPLPIDPLRINKEGKRVDEVCYPDEATRKNRIKFMQQRFKFIDSNKRLISLELAKYNLINSEEQLKMAVEANQREWWRLERKFHLSKIKEQLPMCVVMPGFNNNAKFRIQYNLNSVFTQNYSNYQAVIIEDASTDNSDPLYRSYFSFYAIDKQRYTYIKNSRRATALQNIYQASVNHCRKDSIVVTLDADDEFIGRNVLQVFNWAYQTKRAGVVYSNFYWFLQPQRVWQGFTTQYTDVQKKDRLYRHVKQKFSQLRSWRAELALQLNSKDLQDQKGEFFKAAYDMTLMFPLMQLSCTRVYRIQSEFHYLYNRGTGLNDDNVRYNQQATVDGIVRSRKKYECYQQFDQRMKKLPALTFDQQTVKENLANRVVDIKYASKDYAPLPINPMRRNPANERIDNALYKDEATRKKRVEFIQQRKKIVNANSKFSSLLLSKYNLANSDEELKLAIEENQKDWLRLEAKFGLSKIKEELPMCILVPTFNNNARFRIQSNLNSIFTQNYTNYKVVVINDASTDGSQDIFRAYFAFHAIDKQRYTYIENAWRTYALQNIYYASMNHCTKDSVVMIVCGDDELVGRNTFQSFNWAYQTKKAGVVYSNFYNFQQPKSVSEGWTSEYPQDIKKNSQYRNYTQGGLGQLRTYKNELIFNVKVKDLKTSQGNFFPANYDFALFMAMMEMSCGRVHKVEGEVNILYNLNTGLNDNNQLQLQVANWARKQKKYDCLQEFDKKMEKSNPIQSKNSNTSAVASMGQTSKQLGALPIDLFAKNKEGKTIDEVLYDDATRKKRREFIVQRANFVNPKTDTQSIRLIKYNFVNSEEQKKMAIEDNQREWMRLEKKFGISRLKEELPMCIIVPSYKNNANFRIEGNLNSIFTQNYSNYKVVVINDASPDGSNDIYLNYFNFYAINRQHHVYVENTQRLGTMQNLYQASIKHCAKQAVIFNVDGDDELIGRNVLQVFNWAYQTKKAGVVYSNFFFYQQSHKLYQGFTSQYSEKQKSGNLYRQVEMKFSHLRSYRAELVHQLDPKDLKYENGSFYAYTADFALIIPLLELSCGRVSNIPAEYHYLYNVETGNNDYKSANGQSIVNERVRKLKKYDCYKEFDERMKKLPSIPELVPSASNTNAAVKKEGKPNQ